MIGPVWGNIHGMRQSPEAWAAQLNFASIEQRHGLPAGILTNLVRQESAGNSQAVSHAGARGLCQFMPATAREMGVDVNDPRSSANGAARYLERLMDQFGGDPIKALAAYNWGPGNMRAAIRRHGDDWRNHLPAETADYIRKVGRGIGDSYVARHDRGETTPEQDNAETTRRQQALIDAGVPASVANALANVEGADGILGQMFFALIAQFFTQVMEKSGVNPNATDPLLTSQGNGTQVADATTLPSPTTPAPGAAAAQTRSA